MEGCGPLCQLGVATLQNRAGHDSEVLTASRRAAAIASRLFSDVVVGTLAMRADRAVWPAGGFEPYPGGGFVVKVGGGKCVFGHLKSPMAKTLALVGCGVNYVFHLASYGFCMPTAPDALFKTLADPTRRAIFEQLNRDGEQTVRALTDH